MKENEESILAFNLWECYEEDEQIGILIGIDKLFNKHPNIQHIRNHGYGAIFHGIFIALFYRKEFLSEVSPFFMTPIFIFSI